ncbi:glycoside hydrolase family 16 protein, partial [Streptomyces spinosirectus]
GDPGTSPTLYLGTDGTLAGTAGTADTVTVASADSVNHDGTPYKPQTFTAAGLNMKHTGGTTRFGLAVDAQENVGNGVQLRVSYDCTGSGTWDRVETYRYFATDPVPGWEHYTDKAGPLSATGTSCDLKNGTVQVKIWNALGHAPSTVATGTESTVELPYS